MLNLDHLGEMREMRKIIRIKTIRNLNLDHPGGNAESRPSGGEMREMRK